MYCTNQYMEIDTMKYEFLALYEINFIYFYLTRGDASSDVFVQIEDLALQNCCTFKILQLWILQVVDVEIHLGTCPKPKEYKFSVHSPNIGSGERPMDIELSELFHDSFVFDPH